MTAVATQSRTFDLSPQTFEQALTFANYLAESEMVPKNFRNKPGDCLIAMQWGHEIGLPALQALQNIAVINGKPGLWGDAGKAILLSKGCIIEEDDIAIVQAKSLARCRITRPGRPPVERTYSLENAKTAGLWNKEGPWRTSPYRQMAWRAFWFAARDAAADLLKGINGIEEIIDLPLEPRTEAERTDYVDPQMFMDMIPGCKTDAEAAKLWADHNGKLGKQPKDHKAFKDAVVAHRVALKNASATDVKVKPAKTNAPEVTFQMVLGKLNDAKNEDALNVAADWINALNEAEEIAQLNARYEERQAEMRGAA